MSDLSPLSGAKRTLCAERVFRLLTQPRHRSVACRPLPEVASSPFQIAKFAVTVPLLI